MLTIYDELFCVSSISEQTVKVGCIMWMKTEPCLWVFRIWNYLQDIYSYQPYFEVDIHVASITPPLLCHCLRCVGTLAGNNRLTRTLGVIRAYATIMSAHRGEVPCTVTTAKVRNPGKFLQLWGISKMIPGWLVLQPLDAKSRSELEGVLKGFLESKQVLKLFLKVCYLWEADDLMLKLSHLLRRTPPSLVEWWWK